MDKSEIETSLLIDIPVRLNDKFDFIVPQMKKIFEVNFDYLMNAVNVVYDLNYAIYKNKQINEIIEENNFGSYDTWQLVILLEGETKTEHLISYLTKCLSIHLNEEAYIDEENGIMVGDKSFTKEDYEELCRILKIAYGLEERIEDRQFGSKAARRKAIEMRLNRNEINLIESKTNSFLYQILSVLKTKKSDEEIQNSNLFQLIDLYKRINKEKDYDSLMTGVYTGNVDVKKIDISKRHWTSKLDN